MVWSERGRNPGAAGRPRASRFSDIARPESRISIDIRLLSQGDQRVIPNKALNRGFVFRHETLRSALAALARKPKSYFMMTVTLAGPTSF